MLTTYQVFKLIFGLVVSGFILFFLIQYTSNYAETQKTIQKTKIMLSFLEDAGNVYLSGNSVNLSYTARYDFSSCRPVINDPDLPSISCDFGEVGTITAPSLFRFRKNEAVFLDRSCLEFGFWRFCFTEAMPETEFVFAPLDNNERSWNLMFSITSYLPDTTGSNPKVTFGFCSGDSLDESVCGGEKCEKRDFLDVLRLSHAGVSFSPCTAPLSDRHRLITISGSCSPSFGGAGVCITPPDDRGMGYAYIPGSNEAYIYKDPADIVALVLGAGTHGTSGDRLYHYKNRVLSKRLSLAGSVLSRRALLIAHCLLYTSPSPRD